MWRAGVHTAWSFAEVEQWRCLVRSCLASTADVTELNNTVR
jgi:hypothetical protein